VGERQKRKELADGFVVKLPYYHCGKVVNVVKLPLYHCGKEVKLPLYHCGNLVKLPHYHSKW
jgi:hypothetical protein